jgi:CRP-like cAMP-binding protein
MSLFKKSGSTEVDWLEDVDFFRGFSREQLERVAQLSTRREVPANTVLIDQGDTGTECFVLLNGTASVYVANEHIASLEAGSMVGEMALVDHRPRTASVVADTDLEVLRFDTVQFRALLEEMPKASERVMQLLHDRFRS